MGELINVDQTWSRDDKLHTDPAEHARELGDELELARRAGGEVCMAAFGGERHESPVDVVQHRDPETGTGSDHCGVAAWHRDALLEHRQFVWLENRDGVGERLEVVDHFGALETERGGHRFGVDEPGHVRQPRHLIRYGARHSDARRRDGARVDLPRAQELAHHRFQPIVVERHELADLDRCGPVRFGGEEPEQRLGATDVAGE